MYVFLSVDVLGPTVPIFTVISVIFSSFFVKVGPRELQTIVDQRFSSIDLGDQVIRDSSKIVGSGNYGLVYEGTLHAEQKKVAVKLIRYGDKSARPELEVSTSFVVLLSVHDSVSESTQRSIYLVQAQS